MKQFLVKVNGNTYDVTVEETGCIPASAAPAAQAPAAPAPAPAAPAANVSGGASVVAPMPGTILKVLVNVGDQVSENQPLIVLEAMKMENDIVAPEDGTVASVNVAVGSAVEAGETMATLN